MAGFMNKKGQSFEDGLYMIIMIFALAVGAIVASYSYDQVYDKFANTSAFNSSDNEYSESVMAAFDAGRTINDMWDYLIFFILIGFTLSIVILGYFVDVHTIFMPLYILGMLIGEAFAIIINHVWDEILTDTVFTTIVADFPITDHILSNISIYYLFIAAMGMIALYAKTRAVENR